MKNVEQMMIGNPNGQSVSFKKFVKDVADSKTKYEESLVMQTEIDNLKKEIKTAYSTSLVQHERLVKLIYIHMLGYDATFGVIDAIKFAQQSSLFYKRVGYLVSSLLLDPGREESLLLCCSLQKDLNSESVVEQSMALTAICQLMGKDTISAFLPTIIRKLSHPKEIIRKKAIDVMYQFLCEQPEQTHDERYQKALCDPDAGVMISALPIYLKLTREQPEKYRHMVKAFTDILMQIVEGRLHLSFNYHSFPAPWAQVYLLQILKQVGSNNKQLSEEMSHVLHLVIARASGTMTTPPAADAAVAVLYQVCDTILSIYPDHDLVLLVFRRIDELLQGSCIKIFLGLQLLEKFCKEQPTIAKPIIPKVYQYASHDCEEIQLATARVLRVGVTSESLESASQVLLDLLARDTCSKVVEEACCTALAEMGKNHSPTPVWYVSLLLKILQRSSSNDREPSTILNMLVSFCTSTTDPEVRSLLQAHSDETTSSQLSWLSIWALGRYDTHFTKATWWIERIGDLSDNQKIWLLDSMIVLVSRVGALPPELMSSIQPYCNDSSPIIRQLAVELTNLSNLDTRFNETDALSALISELGKSAACDIENTTAHQQFLKKFRKRANVAPQRNDMEAVTTDISKQRITVPGKDGNPVTSWVSYHEHIPEETSANEKQEPPLSQPALRNVNTWGKSTDPVPKRPTTSSDQAKC